MESPRRNRSRCSTEITECTGGTSRSGEFTRGECCSPRHLLLIASLSSSARATPSASQSASSF